MTASRPPLSSVSLLELLREAREYIDQAESCDDSVRCAQLCSDAALTMREASLAANPPKRRVA